ncbi:MAG: HD domain-containing protein [Oligoflexia bacterium]|nr:HD domain-containing protein [Oligoflexia bacterium]
MIFIPVRINTLRPGHAVNFDVFIKIGERYIHYIRKTDPFDGDRIKSLKTKGVSKLYIPREGEVDYLKYLDEGLGELKNVKIDIRERSLFAQDSLITAAENAQASIASTETYRQSEQRILSVAEFLYGEKNALHEMLSSGVAKDIYEHSSHVSTLALKLASKVGITAEKDLKPLGMAALLHDIGKEGSGLDPLLPREKLDPEQLKVYRGHPERAVTMIQDKAHIGGEVVEMILNHEEIGAGVGFPGKKHLARLSLSQQVLNLCNEYDRMCNVNGTSPLEAIKQFRFDKIGLFDLKLIDQLAAILKV